MVWLPGMDLPIVNSGQTYYNLIYTEFRHSGG